MPIGTRALLQTIAALSRALEMRDPYTAGHQRRVADLSRRIGQQLGMGSDAIDGMRIGATIHDLGKIAIPLEILTKPGRLMTEEMALVRCHPALAVSMLTEVEFPLPVMAVIEQHHERMDGSGYPGGLHGDAVIPEARIVAVADVVDSMTSHRPYHPALPLEAACDELRLGRGGLYDIDVVDACLKILSPSGG